MSEVGSVSKTPTTKRVLVTAFIVDSVDITLNAITAVITGSVVMLVESLKGVADLVAVGLLLIGHRRSMRKPTRLHPFGYGKEIYFWTVLSAFILLMITAGLSFYFGLQETLNPTAVETIGLAYIVLSISICTNSYTLIVSVRKLLAGKSVKKLPGELLHSTQVEPRTTSILDLMGTSSAIIGLTALLLYGITGYERLDGIGSIAISIALAFFGAILLASLRGLIVGQSASKEMESKIRQAALSVPEVRKIISLQTMLLGPNNTLVNIEINLQNNLNTNQVERVIENIRQEIEAVAPRVDAHIEPGSTSKSLLSN
jgi:cation diffusion facilitator family transporter